MAVKIRLNRMGAKKNPFYRIVVADSRAPRDGRFIEVLGNYDSTKEPAIVNVDEEKALEWMNKGAQPTDTVKSLFSKQGIMDMYDDEEMVQDFLDYCKKISIAMKTVLELAEEKGVRDKYIFMVGGAPVTDNFAKEIGADYYTPDAATAAEVAKKAVTA